MRQLKITQKKTSSTGITNKHFVDINKIKKIPEGDIIKKLKNGDESAKELLITNNLGFVVSVARNYYKTSLKYSLDDLIGFGHIGLIRAAKKYDYTTGFKFISYAVWYIRSEILKVLYEQDTIKIPQKKMIELAQIDNEHQLNEQLIHTNKSNDFSKLHLSPKYDLNHHKNMSRSFDAKLTDDMSLLDVLSGESQTDRKLIKDSNSKELVRIINDTLTYNNKYVVLSIFGLGYKIKTTTELAEEFNVSTTTIRNMLNKSLRRLKYKFKIEKLDYGSLLG